ncbi:TIM barrel protein [Dactylosporangium darangshiense]|uniref:TIM barrel protein n=2 Tax=Dactylosporangium darangshiense TaxID=579108 RepID=A0ABP8DI35_9ACTN
MRFAANLSILYGHLPLLERPAAAASAGFAAVEMWWPWDGPEPDDRNVDTLEDALEQAGVQLVAMNLIEGDMRAGDRGLLSSPARAQRFRDCIDTAVGFAERNGCPVLNALAGNREAGVSADEQYNLAVESLWLAANAAQRAGLVVALEAINRHEAPHYLLGDADTAVALADAVNAATGLNNTGFLCDLYHHGRNGEDIPALLARHAARIAHVQIADTPGRGRPGSGELDYPDLFGRLAAHGYDGWVGLEYEPVRNADIDFDWLPSLRPRI